MMIVHPSTALEGTARVPGDKSVTHRALMLASLCNGVTEIWYPGTGEDNLSTLNAMRALGVEAEHVDAEHFVVRGVGLHGLQSPTEPIDCGNSGTTARLLAGLLAGAGVEATLVGDESLSSRPMRRVSAPLNDLGYEVETSDGGTLPLYIKGTGTRQAEAVNAVLRTASAQVKSCILLSGLFREQDTMVTEPAASRDHTERLFRALGIRCASTQHYTKPAEWAAHESAPSVQLVPPSDSPRATRLDVPGDPSSAAFLIAAALVTGGEVEIENVGLNPTRAAFLDVLTRMGAKVEIRNRRVLSTGEPAGDLRVSSGPLKATVLEGAEIPLIIDEIPILCVVGALAEGRFVVRDAAELRVKESDRIDETARLLRLMGLDVACQEDGLSFEGRGAAGWTAFKTEMTKDHRIAMSEAVAALGAVGPCEILGADAIAVSFPTFARTLNLLGARIEENV